jgi:hypothetical protein
MQFPVLSRVPWPRVGLLAASGLVLVLVIVHCLRPKQEPEPPRQYISMDEHSFRRALEGQRLLEGVKVGDLDLGVVPAELPEPEAFPGPIPGGR